MKTITSILALALLGASLIGCSSTPEGEEGKTDPTSGKMETKGETQETPKTDDQ